MLDSDALADLIAELVGEHVERATAPLIARIAELESRPAPERGEPGERGSDGADGRDGKDADPEVIHSLVAEAVAGIPVPQDGKDGRDGADGKDGEPGQAGKDGAGIADLVIDREGHLVASFTDGRMKNLGRIVGKDGADGKDGRDGFSLEHFDTKWDGDRTLTLSFSDGQSEYSHELRMPFVIDRGVFVEGKSYEAGDGTTWGGSFWIAQRDTSARPDSADSGWRLAVKRGRDGKDKA
jgi:integrin beta 3